MHDARLGDRLRPHGFDGGGQALESVADHHADIADTTVFDFGEHPDPELRPLPVAVLTGPQPEDVAGALHRHRERDIDRPVRDVTVADLHVHGVDEDHWIHRADFSGRCESDGCVLGGVIVS